MSLEDLATFVRVTELGSFTAAARELAVPKSTVSRRVGRLEAELGVALLRRAARSFALTDHGRALADRCGPALRELQAACSAVRDSDERPSGQLTISAAIDFAQSACLTALLASFRERHPGVRVLVDATNRAVDIYEEQVDVAFRLQLRSAPSEGSAPPSAAGSEVVVARRLARLDGGLYAAPAVAAALEGRPLDGLPFVGHGLETRWVLHGPEGEVVLELQPVAASSNFAGVAALATAGAGVARLPAFVADPLVARGELVRVLPHLSLGPVDLTLLWLRSRHLAPRVRAFVDHAAEWWAESPYGGTGSR